MTDDTARCCLDFARLRAKHKAFAEQTNQMLTEQHAEIQALRAELDQLKGATA